MGHTMWLPEVFELGASLNFYLLGGVNLCSLNASPILIHNASLHQMYRRDGTVRQYVFKQPSINILISIWFKQLARMMFVPTPLTLQVAARSSGLFKMGMRQDLAHHAHTSSSFQRQLLANCNDGESRKMWLNVAFFLQICCK